MKTFISFVLNLFLIISVLCAQYPRVAEVNFYLGEVYQKDAEETLWHDIKLYQALELNDQLRTDSESRCELLFHNQDIARLGEETSAKLVLQNEEIVVVVDSGNVWINACKNGKRRVKIQTPTAVAAIRGTVYRVTSTSFFSRMVVFNGEVAINPVDPGNEETSGKSFTLKAGQKITIIKDFEKYKKYLESEYQDYIRREKDEFKKFLMQQQNQFRDYVRKMEDGFEEFNSMKIKTEQFSLDEELKSDWVKWNLERDKKINR